MEWFDLWRKKLRPIEVGDPSIPVVNYMKGTYSYSTNIEGSPTSKGRKKCSRGGIASIFSPARYTLILAGNNNYLVLESLCAAGSRKNLK